MENRTFSPENDLKTQSLAEMYNDSAALYHKTFPEKLANLFVTLGETPVFLAPEVADFLTDNIKDVKRMVGYRVEALREQGWSAIATGIDAVLEDETEIHVKHLLLMEGAGIGFVSNLQPVEMNRIGIFDHEMGHFIVKNGMDENVNLAECAADAYAALRHIQRFGSDTGMLDFAAAHRAETIVRYGVKTHHTSAVFQKIKALQAEGTVDVKALSLPRTAALAADLAASCARDDATLTRIHDAYAGFRDALAQDDPEKAVKAVAAAVVKNKNDAAVRNAGKLLLDSPRIQSFIAAAGLDDDPVILESRAVAPAAVNRKRAPRRDAGVS